MAEKITVKDFIENINGDVDALEVREYIPITEKRLIIEKLILEIMTEDGLLVTYDSIVKDMVFSLASICVYTNLEATTDEDYDKLCETGLLDEIFKKIGMRDFRDFHTMFEIRFEDYMRDANTLMGTVNKLFKEFKEVFEQLDPEQLKSLLKLLDTAMA